MSHKTSDESQETPESPETEGGVSDVVDSLYEELDDVDRMIVKLKLEKPGIKNVEIARIIGGSQDRVGDRLKKVAVQRILAEATKPAIKILLDAQPRAARRLRKEIDNPDANIAMQACREILKGVLSENINLSVSQNAEVKAFLDSLTDEDIERMVSED